MPEIALHSLKGHRLNPNSMTDESFEKLLASMRYFGRCAPVIARPHPKKPECSILLDGHNRVRAAKFLDWKTIPCQIWDISAKDAQLALATLNRLRGTDIPQKRAELLASLTETFTFEALAELIPESEAQIQDMLRFLETDFNQLEAALKSEMEREEASLPIPYTFLVNPVKKDIVDEALRAFKGKISDQGEILVQICSKALEGFYGKA